MMCDRRAPNTCNRRGHVTSIKGRVNTSHPHENREETEDGPEGASSWTCVWVGVHVLTHMCEGTHVLFVCTHVHVYMCGVCLCVVCLSVYASVHEGSSVWCHI